MSYFPCNQCNKRFRDRIGLKQHQASSHQSSGFGTGGTCRFGSRSFPNEAAKQQHIYASHKDTKGASGTGYSLFRGSLLSSVSGGAAVPPLGCTAFQRKFCHKGYPSREILQHHTTDKHSAGNNKRPKTAPSYACGFCNRSFHSPEAKRQHVNDNHRQTATIASLLNIFQTTGTAPGYVCRICNRSFPSPEAKQQHVNGYHRRLQAANTSLLKIFQGSTTKSSTGTQSSNTRSCSLCNKTYSSPEALQQHVGNKHPSPAAYRQISSQVSQGKVLCRGCNKSLSTKDAMLQHAKDSHPQTLTSSDLAKLTKPPKTPKPYRCIHCDDSFDSNIQLQQHVSQKHKDQTRKKSGSQSEEHVCITCYVSFSSQIAAEQHRQAKVGHTVKLSTRKLAVDCFLKAAQVNEGDRKESVSLFRNTIQTIMNHVRTGIGGKIYSPDVARAGSTAVNVKIGKADEFDVNIPLNIPTKKLVTDGFVEYIYADRINVPEGQKVKVNLNVSRELVRCGARRIPEGQAVVKVREGSVPRGLVFGEDLIPNLCQKDFYDKVRTAILIERIPNVKLSREAHGPAITLTITPPRGHVISVDLTLSLACDLKLSQFRWPRPMTLRAFKPEKIAECIKAPIHLVPKGDDTWAISFSKVEQALLIGIDSGNECRRHVMQILKRHLQICSSSSSQGLEGISSYIVKQHILWSAERYTSPGYWDKRRMDECVIDVMGDLIKVLRAGMMPLYFKPSVNVLQHKRRDILNILVKYFDAERDKLLKME